MPEAGNSAAPSPALRTTVTQEGDSAAPAGLAAGSLVNRWVGVSWGALLLLTLAIPWGLYGSEPFWFGMFFRPRYQPTSTKVMLIGVWLTGLVVLIASLWLRRLSLACTYLVAGGAAVILYVIGTQADLLPWQRFVPIVTEQGWLLALGVLALVLFLVATGIRARSGTDGAIRAVQGLASAAVAAFLGLAVYDGLGTVKELLATSSGLWTWLFLTFGFTVAGLAALGCLLSLWHSLRFGESGRETTAVGRRLVFASLALLFVWGCTGPAIQNHHFSAVLGSLNSEIFLAGIMMVTLEGLIGVWARPARAVSPENAGAARRSAVRTTALYLGGVSALAALAGGIVLAVAPRAGLQASQQTEPPAIVRTVDWPQWCRTPDRNMVCDAQGLPDRFEELTKEKTSGLSNVKWVVSLGSNTPGSPVVSGGKVYIGGTVDVPHSNETLGLFWCFRESDGKLLWRMRSPYHPALYNNRSFGICATPTVEGDRVYLLGHLGDMLCLSADGLAGGNKGPFLDEAQYYATGSKRVKSEIAEDGRRILDCSPGTPATLGPLDADILWKFDLLREVNCWPFNALNAAVLIRGDRLYVATCSALTPWVTEGSLGPVNAWKEKYRQTSYDSPALIVLDKQTGKLLATEKEGIFERTFHGAHASPALGKVKGKELLFYGGGDGVCYAFDPDFVPGPDGQPGQLKLVWKFNCLDSATYDAGFRIDRLKKAETLATPVSYKNRIYTSLGNDLTFSGSAAKPGRLLCLDATQTGDVTHTARIWSFDDIRSTSSTVAVADGLLYTADASGIVYCLDAGTGQVLWTQRTAPVWSSPLVADGKVYVATHGQGLLVFAHSREKQVLYKSEGHMEFIASPAVANGVLYLASRTHLYALEVGRSGGLVPHGE